MTTVPGTHFTKQQLEADLKGVPENYLCAMKWYLKSAEQNHTFALNNIGVLFENGRGVPLDKYKKRKKLEEKKYKTLEEIETFEQLNITYKITDGEEDAWKDVPMLLSQDIKLIKKSVDEAVANYKDEIQTLKRQMQLLEQEKNTFKDQIKELPLLKQKDSSLELQMEQKNSKIASLENENRTYRTASLNQTQKLEMLNHEKATWEQNKQYTDTEITSLKESKVTLEQLLKSKEDIIVSLNHENQTLSTANQGNQQEMNEKKQHSQPSIATSSNSTAVSGDNISYINTNGDDDVNNDINYDTKCGTKDSTNDSDEDDHINYDTPSESENEDAHNDFNYDDDNQISNKQTNKIIA
ncbi:hypothetical protein K501DRAFT_269391 [Backusella circina FSU 941]|nr:hypothetical protein K501DRAFT_269391 [Backusella circina FSU 941]